MKFLSNLSTVFKKQNMSTTKSSGNSRIIFLVIIVVLLSVIGYLLFSNLKKDSTIENQDAKIEETEGNLEAKIAELEQMQIQYQSLMLQNQELGRNNDSIQARLAELDEYIKQVKAGNAKAVKDYKNTIARLNQDLVSKEQEIIKLRSERDSLSVAVDGLKTTSAQLNDSLNSTKNQNTDLQRQVAIASVLRAENVKVVALNDKGKEDIDGDFKTKSIYSLSFTFNLADNKVARKDKKQMMIRIIDPSGKVLFDVNNGGGFFMVADTKKDMQYTIKESILFDNSKQSVSMKYIKKDPYMVGTYSVEIWGEGYLIGESSFVVK